MTLALRDNDDIQRMSWSVSQRLPRSDRRSQQAFEELTRSCRDLLARSFPGEEGYELIAYEISGPVEGVRYVARRGRLRAVLSIQRFVRHQGPSHGDPPLEIRLVGTLGRERDDEASAADRTLAGWGVAGCALGTIGVSALALGSAGLISAWLQAALLIPALLAWRTCATIGIAKTMQRQAALQGAREQACDHSMAEAIAKWRKLLPALEIERELIGERLGLPPFRNPARALRPASHSAA